MSAERLRGTQSVVGQMGWVFARPSLTALEVAWRTVFGVPILFACWNETQKILAKIPPDSAGLTSLDSANPWTSAVQLADAWKMYQPHVLGAMVWLAPTAALAWIVTSGIGRNLVLQRMEPQVRFRPGVMIALQGLCALAVALAAWGWYASIGWAAATHFAPQAEPDLIGYTIWVVFLSLGFVALWAALSWIVTIGPVLALLEDCGAGAALARSLELGKPFTAKLVEINFVMTIVKLALIVVAMVFSSVLIPFAEQVGAGTLHLEWLVVSIFYFIANDYFEVVRLKGFVEFWKLYRHSPI